MLLHFALVLHFAAILITFCGDYYISRRNTLTLRFWSKQICLGLAIVNSISCFNYYFIYTRDEAEMEYLKIAQDLEMYGVSYFEIKVL